MLDRDVIEIAGEYGFRISEVWDDYSVWHVCIKDDTGFTVLDRVVETPLYLFLAEMCDGILEGDTQGVHMPQLPVNPLDDGGFSYLERWLYEPCERLLNALEEVK